MSLKHPPKPLSKKQFNDLQDVWYEKLKSQGFKDLEDKNHNLMRYETSRLIDSSKYSWSERLDVFNDKRDYFRLVSMFLHDHQFETMSDKEIWSLHSEGKTFDQIYAMLKSRYKIKYRRIVSDTIQRLKKDMIKFYGSK